MILRFRAEPSQADNLRVRVYTQSRGTLLSSVSTGITETIAGSGSYECEIGAQTGYWYVLVDFLDTGEVTTDGFASQWVPEVVDYLPPNNGLGLHAITVTVEGDALIAGANVTVSQSGQPVAWGTTNGSGTIEFALNAGTYGVLVQPPTSAYEPFAVQSLVVTTSASVTYTLTEQTITPPALPGLCTVVFVVLGAGEPVANALVQVELEDSNPTVDTALSRAVHTGRTDSGGRAELTMIQHASFTSGGVYRIAVKDASGRKIHSRRVTVPTLSTIYAEDLPDAT